MRGRPQIGARHVDRKVCRESLNHCGRRIMLSLQLNDGKSWGAREEHRMSLSLLMIVNSESRCGGNPTLRNGGTLDPFDVHRTKTVNQFTEQIVVPYARWYQEILGMSEEGHLGVDRQKLAIVSTSLLKCSSVADGFPFPSMLL
jgi:hypothetical protein